MAFIEVDRRENVRVADVETPAPGEVPEPAGKTLLPVALPTAVMGGLALVARLLKR